MNKLKDVYGLASVINPVIYIFKYFLSALALGILLRSNLLNLQHSSH